MPNSPSSIEAWWRRVSASPIQRAGLARPLEQWTTRGGRLCLVGPRGSGRTRLLTSVMRSLDHSRQPYLLFTPGRVAGASVVAALQSLGVSSEVPLFPDAGRRARHATVRILEGWQRRHAEANLLVVVDDIDQLDPLTRSVLAALLREPRVQLLAAGPIPIDGLQTVEVTPISAEETASIDTSTTVPAEPAYIGQALLQRMPGAKPKSAAPWSSLQRLDGLGPKALELLHLVAVCATPAPRARLGRLLGLDLAGLARACRSVSNRGLVVESGGALRLASPADAAELERHFGTSSAVHRRASQLMASDHPGQVAHALVVPPPDLAELLPAFDALIQWDPASATRWGRALVARAASVDIARKTAEAAMSCRRRDIAVRVLHEAAARTSDVHIKVALHALAGLQQLASPADISAARHELRQAHAACGGDPHPPAELFLLESRLRMVADGPGMAVAQIRSARDSLPAFVETTAQIREHEAEVYAALGRLDDAVKVWSTLVDTLDIPDRERVALHMATHLKKAQRLLDASHAMLRLAHAERDVPDATQAKALDNAALLALGGGDPGAAIAHWTAAIELSEHLHAANLVARVRPRLAAALREVCRFDEAKEVVDTAWADRTMPVGLRLECALIAGDVAMAVGQLAEAEKWFDRAGTLVSDDPESATGIRVERRKCELDALRQHPHALERVTTAARAAHRARASRDLSRLHAIRAYLLAKSRRPDEVAPTLERAEAPLRDAGAGRLLAEVRIWAARAWLALGELEGARKSAAKAVVWAEETGHLRLREEARSLLDAAREQHGRPTQRLDRLLEVSTALASERDPERIYQRTVAACAELLHAERAFCVLADGEGPRIAAAWRGDGQPPGTPSRAVVRAVLGHGREIAVGDVEERAELRRRDSIVGTRVRSVMCVPMFDKSVDGASILGVLYVDSPARSPDEVEQALRILRALAAQSAVALGSARAFTDIQERARRATDMAHDLRSPAAALQMAGEELAGSGELPEWAREGGQLIATQARRILDIGNRYLSDRRSDPGVFSLGAVAEQVGRVAAPLARARGRSVLVDVLAKVMVEAAEDDIQRVLLNLVQNGLRHTPEGSAVVIRVDRTADGRACCDVIDSGDGVPPELLPHIFTRGVRGDREGFGLGLSIAQRLSTTWGGELSVHNVDRQGACFRLTLPEAEGVAAQAR